MRRISSLPRRVFLFFVAFTLTACEGEKFNATKDMDSKLNPERIDFEQVDYFAQRSNAAYLSPETIRAQFPDTIRVSIPKGTATQYFLERSDERKSQIVSIQGTANRADVIFDTEIEIEPHTSIGIPLHRGFRRVALNLYQDLKPHLEIGYETRITGHSLGAAVSSILMFYLERDGYKVVQVVNFGQPKFTTTEGKRHFDHLPLKRVVDRNDVVPMLPPSSFVDAIHGSYEHIGQEIILLKGKEYIVIAEHDAERLSVGDFWRNLAVADVEDHRIARYIERIGEKLKIANPITYVSWKLGKN